MEKTLDRELRCGIVLAGGEGQRLQPLIRRLRGDSLPKQYVSFIGGRSMLEHTLKRADRLIPPERLLTVVNQAHLGYPEARRQLAGRTRGTVVIQPENKDTLPGLLLPLMNLHDRCPEATVAVFPSDHFIADESLFTAYVDLAFRIVERYPRSFVLLGVEPEGPEPDYGYILPGLRVGYLAPLPVREVSRFVEKPGPKAAEELVREEGLWNTMIMVFKVKNLLEMVRRVYPQLHVFFRRIREAIGSAREAGAVAQVYRQIEPVNFSSGLLQSSARLQTSLLVLPLKGVVWSDWGSEERIRSTLKKAGCLERLDLRGGA